MIASFAVGLVPPGGAEPAASTPCAEEQSEPLTDDVLWWLVRRPWWRAPPGRPEPPDIVQATGDSLTAIWPPPADGSPVPTTGYDVGYRAAGDADYIAWPHDSDAPEATITGLVDDTTYQIRVRAANEFGAGDWSLPGTGTTLIARPQFAEGESATREVPENTVPGSPVGSPVTATAGRRSPAYALSGPDADAFLVDDATGQISTRDGVAYDHEVRPRYELAVEATAGEHVASLALTVFVTDVDEPPDAPARPSVESATATSLTIGWEEPGNTGPRIDDYDVEYRSPEEDFQDAGHDGRARTARLTGLESQTQYEFRVRAANAEGTGPWSELGAGMTRTPLPNSPPRILADRLPSTTTLTAGGAAERFDLSDAFAEPDDEFVWLEAASRNSSVAVAAVEGHVVVVRPIAVGRATIAVTAHDPMGQTAAGTFMVIVGAQLRSDPTATFDTTGDNLTVEFTDAFALDEQRSYEARARQKAPVGSWGTFCFTATNNAGTAADLTVSVEVSVDSFAEPGMTYEVVYRYRGSSCADSVSAGWSRVAEATTPGSSRFDIDAVVVGTATASLRSAVESAADTWASIVTTSLPDIDFSDGPISLDGCVPGQAPVADVIDDLRIFVRLASIDGVGGTLASAGPCFRRRASWLPAVAQITLDSDDLEDTSPMLLRHVLLHEMGHALGFGIWHEFSLLRNPALNQLRQEVRPPPDTHFVGPLALAAFDVAGGSSHKGGKVPVANVGGAGRADSHWRESVLGHELMTPILTIGQAQPLSAITIQSLADLGYGVDVSRAESFALPQSATSFALRAQVLAATVPGRCVVTSGSGTVDEQLHIVPIAVDAVSLTGR
ncbi:MAG: fibronectin type III domain-containing protein [Gammaproteobacteria bacterium]|nr:fibronectin type III domain-containing protein [Gammaproteobacteria bacterium]